MPISDAEATVMQVLWDNHPLSAEEVVRALAHQQQWQEATIKTLLNRLLKKRAISATKEGRRYLYSPLLDREQWILAESQGFLDRMFDGQLAPLVAHFSQNQQLSAEDIAALKGLIEGLDDES